MRSKNDTNFLRFVAIVLVINSHLDSFYPVNFFGTGGSIGNALFFMLSGFGLSLSAQNNQLSFLPWYTKRIIRIYPSVWLTVFFLILPFSLFDGTFIKNDLLSFIGNFLYPPFWFLKFLLFLYIFAYFFIKHYNLKLSISLFILFSFLYFFCYFLFLDIDHFTIQNLKDSPFVLIIYTIIFTFGITLSHYNSELNYSGKFDIIMLLFLVALFYLHKSLMTKGLFLNLQFLQDVLLIPIAFYFLKISRSDFISICLMKSKVGKLIEYISSISLLLYIVHSTFGTKFLKLGIIFPINVLLYIGTALIIAALFNFIIVRYINKFIFNYFLSTL